jgi:hypothetical protein
LVAIHPGADSLPENTLRWYLEFSAPMFPGRALTHVRLIDDRGAEVRGAFLDLSEELWDPTGRRLTLLFDPGRVKQGIRTNLESGRPLRAGQAYALVVDSAWPDARGTPLAKRVEKRFVAIAADQIGPDPTGWRVTAPGAASLAPLEIDFGEPLDQALASRLIAVQDDRGRPVEGTVALDRSARRWRFQPAEKWQAGRYQLLVSPELEDVAGNRPGKPFDTDVSAGGSAYRTGDPMVRWLEIR